MKKFLILAAVPAALVGLGACSTYDDYGYGSGYADYGYSDYGPSYGGNYYNPSYSSGSIWYDAYYDDFYGPVDGGYWAPDGYFWYQSRIGGGYVRDHDRHFRRDNYRGYKQYRYQDNRGHGRDNDQWRANDRNTYPPLFSGQNNNRGRENDRDRDRGRDNNPRGNPAPTPQWNGDRGNGGRGNNGRDDNRAGRDRDRNNGGQNANPNPPPNGNGGPPLFGGQQPRANPAPAPQPQLDGAPRGDNRNNDGARNNERGRYRQGAAPPQPQANPAPPPQPQANPSPPQQQPREANRNNNRDDNDRGVRARGGDRSDGGDRDRSRGNGRGGRRD